MVGLGNVRRPLFIRSLVSAEEEVTHRAARDKVSMHIEKGIGARILNQRDQ